MIRYLGIRNLAVIASASVEFEHSFNALTGETGAGKSILIEAVGLLLGGRASQDLVRTGEDLATIEAIFEHGGREVVVRREITAQGRSRAFVDGQLATAAALKELASSLVELHGQHEHQQLLDPARHIPLLDSWARLDHLQAEVAEAFARVRNLRDQLDRLKMDSRERAARRELVEFQLNELVRASLIPDEDEELAALRQVLRSAETIRRLSGESYAELYESESSVLSGLAHVWKRVGELSALDGRFAPHLDQRDAIKAQLEDLAFTLRDFAESIDASPGRLEEVEERLALLDRLKRKHGPTLADVIAVRERLAAEHAALSGDSASPEAVARELAAVGAHFLDRARALSRARRTAGDALAGALQQELAALAMEHARVAVRLTANDAEEAWSERGIDSGEFFLSANPGEDPRPLARIVSGGELSRVMLALKTLAAADQPDKTLIFDEVDAGIGGRVATVVGQKLRALGNRFQVLCITHLPQIAAAADTQFLIEKEVRSRRTLTSVTRLDDAARVEEIARMVGGGAAGDQARATARELLAAAPAREAKAKAPAKAKGENPMAIAEKPARRRPAPAAKGGA